ncbi:MAG: DNA polymerase III subunit delta [Candidatus Zixiibacteriota bacterium]
MGFSEDRARGRYGPRYVIVAENPYVLWDAVDDWKRVMQREGRSAIDIFHAPRVDFDQLLDTGATIPMFGEQRLVLIHDINKIPTLQQERLTKILATFGDTTRVLMTATSLDKRTKFAKFLMSWAEVEEFPRIFPDRLPGWAQRIAGDLGCRLSPQAATLLADTYGDDLFAVRQTIERTALFVHEKRRIELADIELGLSGDGQHTVFLLLDTVAEPNLARSLHVVRSLFSSGEQPVVWLSALASLLQRLVKLAELNEPNDNQAARLTGIRPFFLAKARRQVEYFGHRGLAAALYACFETEWAIKTSRLSPHVGWELLVYRLCSKRALVGPPLFDLENSQFAE